MSNNLHAANNRFDKNTPSNNAIADLVAASFLTNRFNPTINQTISELPVAQSRFGAVRSSQANVIGDPRARGVIVGEGPTVPEATTGSTTGATSGGTAGTTTGITAGGPTVPEVTTGSTTGITAGGPTIPETTTGITAGTITAGPTVPEVTTESTTGTITAGPTVPEVTTESTTGRIAAGPTVPEATTGITTGTISAGPTVPEATTGSTTGATTPVINNRDKYKEILDLDHNGIVSDQEIMLYELNRRRTNGAVLDMSADQNAQKVFAAINSMDANNDGIISSIETLNAIITSKATNTNVNITEANTAMVLGTNNQFNQLKQALETLTLTASQTRASDDEVVNILLALRAAGLGGTDWTTADYLKHNAQVGKISTAVNTADSSSDGVISDDEALNLYLESRKGTIDAPLGAINCIESKNANSSQILSALNQVEAQNDGIISDEEVAAALTKLRNNQFDPATAAIVNKILATNTHTAQLNHMLTNFDTDKDGKIKPEEFAIGYLKMRKLNIPALGEDALTYLKAQNPDIAAMQSMLDTLDVNGSGMNDGIISRSDFATKLSTLLITNGTIDNEKKRILKSFASGLPGLSDANDLINKIDTASELTFSLNAIDGNNNGVSNTEMAKLIADDLSRVKKLKSLDETLLKFINPEYAAIRVLIKDYTAGKGKFDNDLLVVNLVAKFKQGRITQDQYNMFLSIDPSLTTEKLDAIRKALELMDPDGNRDISEKDFNPHQEWLKQAENLSSRNNKKQSEAKAYMNAHPEYNFYEDGQYPSGNDMQIFNMVSDYLRDKFGGTAGFGRSIKDL